MKYFFYENMVQTLLSCCYICFKDLVFNLYLQLFKQLCKSSTSPLPKILVRKTFVGYFLAIEGMSSGEKKEAKVKDRP